MIVLIFCPRSSPIYDVFPATLTIQSISLGSRSRLRSLFANIISGGREIKKNMGELSPYKYKNEALSTFLFLQIYWQGREKSGTVDRVGGPKGQKNATISSLCRRHGRRGANAILTNDL